MNWADVLTILREVSYVIVFGGGYWLGHSGITGIVTDIKTDISDIKTMITPTPATPAPTPVTPSAPVT